MSSIPSACGQSNGYPPLAEREFDTDKIYSLHKNDKYVFQYILYNKVPTYVVKPNPQLRTEPLPWATKEQPTSKVLELLTSRLSIYYPDHPAEQKYVSFLTSVPENMGDVVSELLTVNLQDYRLTDAANNNIEIDGVALSYNTLFEENGTQYQNIAIKMYIVGENKFSDIADGYVNLTFDLATGFDNVMIDKLQRGKIFTFDEEQIELIEMEQNTVHLKLAASNDKRSDWEFIPCNNGKPMRGSLSMDEYPFAFYDFARSNKGLTYYDFEKEAIANEAAWQDNTSDRSITLYFECPVTSLYIYKPKYTSGEKRIEIKKKGN